MSNENISVYSTTVKIIKGRGENLSFDLSTPELLTRRHEVLASEDSEYEFGVTLQVDEGANIDNLKIIDTTIVNGKVIDTTEVHTNKYSDRSGDKLSLYFNPGILDSGMLARTFGELHNFELSANSEIIAKWTVKINPRKI